MPRLRQFYQVYNVYVGPTGYNPATGALQLPSQWGNISGSLVSGNNLISELYRITKCDTDWDRQLKPVVQYGNLAYIDQVQIDPPKVTMSLSYNQANLVNENLLGFTVAQPGSVSQVNCLSGILGGASVYSSASKNMFIKIVQEGYDANNLNPADYDVYALGNTFITSYSAQGKVADFPTVDIGLEALNFQAQHVWGTPTGYLAVTPAIYPSSGLPITGWGYTLPTGVNSYGNAGLSNVSGLSVLRPGDIILNLGLNPGDGFASPSDIKVQNYNLSFNLNLEDLLELGSKYAYAKVPRFPVEATLAVTAIIGDNQTGSLLEIVNNNLNFNPQITIFQPTNPPLTNPIVTYIVNGAKLRAQKFTTSLSNNTQVDFTFTAAIGAPQDSTHGVYMSGISAGI